MSTRGVGIVICLGRALGRANGIAGGIGGVRVRVRVQRLGLGVHGGVGFYRLASQCFARAGMDR